MDKFGELPIDVQALLESILKNYSIAAEDLYFKWESWGFKMGNNPPLDLEHATLFKQDIQSQLEYSNQSKPQVSGTPVSSKKISSNVVAAYEDFLGGDMTPLNKRVKREPMSSARKLLTPSKAVTSESTFATPLKRKLPETATNTPFSNRKDPGTIVQVLDPYNLSVPLTAAPHPPPLTANFDPKKYSYRPMYQKLSEVSEILDDQIDQYADVILESFNLKDEDLGNPSLNTQTDTIVVGRIVCDSLDGGRLNASSVMLETSRRLGTGSRTKLDLSSVPSFSLFPGQLVALKGVNAASKFKVAEIMIPTALPPSASTRDEFGKEPMTIVVAAGPYTPNSDLSFEALKVLRQVIVDTKPDSVILAGPFIDLSHPLIKSGDFDSDSSSLDGLFQELITPLIKDFPNLLLIPHTNDAISRHPCLPQDSFPRSSTGLSKAAKLLPNPCLFSLSEVSIGISTTDILKPLTLSEISRAPSEKNGLARQSSHILQQRRFYPLFPGSPSSSNGPETNLDMGFIGLTEFGARVPDILISPSDLTTFVKVVDGVIVVNPGSLSKKSGSGTFARIYVAPKSFDGSLGEVDGVRGEVEGKGNSEGLVPHELWKRSRVEIVRI